MTPDRTTESLFEELVVNGIIVKYPEFYMKQYFGDRAYAARVATNPAPGGNKHKSFKENLKFYVLF